MDDSDARLGRGFPARASLLLLGVAAALCVLAIGAGAAAAHGRAGDEGPFGHFGHWLGYHPGHHGGPQTCSGSFESPGVLSGTYNSGVSVSGFCIVNAGAAVVRGNLTVRPGGALIAAFALNDQTGTGSSSLTVKGNVFVGRDAALVLGCLPTSFACFDDNPEEPTLSSPGAVFGNLIGSQALGVIVHNSTVSGNVSQIGGGGGETCEPSGPFAALGAPAYSDYEDSSFGGNLDVIGLNSCWLGTARDHVGGNMSMINNQLLDPDAIEILANQISGNLICIKNSMVWNSADLAEEGLFPRLPEPNTVDGNRIGQCVLASPTTEGGPPGPGPF